MEFKSVCREHISFPRIVNASQTEHKEKINKWCWHCVEQRRTSVSTIFTCLRLATHSTSPQAPCLYGIEISGWTRTVKDRDCELHWINISMKHNEIHFSFGRNKQRFLFFFSFFNHELCVPLCPYNLFRIVFNQRRTDDEHRILIIFYLLAFCFIRLPIYYGCLNRNFNFRLKRWDVKTELICSANESKLIESTIFTCRFIHRSRLNVFSIFCFRSLFDWARRILIAIQSIWMRNNRFGAAWMKGNLIRIMIWSGFSHQ